MPKLNHWSKLQAFKRQAKARNLIPESVSMFDSFILKLSQIIFSCSVASMFMTYTEFKCDGQTDLCDFHEWKYTHQ